MFNSTVAYDAPFALGEVVNPEDGHGADLGIREGPDQPDQGEPGDERAHHTCQPGPRAAGQRERDPLQQAPKSHRAPLVLGGQPAHLLGERRHLAGPVAADEPADLQFDLDRTAAARQIVQMAPVPVVPTCGRRGALWADSQLGAGARDDPRPVAGAFDLLEHQAVQMREQQTKQTGLVAGDRIQHNDSNGRFFTIKILAIQIMTERPHSCAPSYQISTNAR
jgi:hypothetical protein